MKHVDRTYALSCKPEPEFVWSEVRTQTTPESISHSILIYLVDIV